MELGLVGLGRMGGRMAARLTAHGHPVIAHDRAPEALAAAARDGVRGARSLRELVDAMAPPRVVCLMLPAGEAPLAPRRPVRRPPARRAPPCVREP